MTLGDFINYILFTGLMAAPVVQIASIGTQISEAFAGLDRIRELMQMRPRTTRTRRGRRSARSTARSSFEDVRFEYNPGVPVLKHVSFRAPAGTTTALVGSSGSGKSTLISLVMAFNRPKSGRDPRRRPRPRDRSGCATTASQLGVVLQDNFLFDGTIGDNIRYGASPTRRWTRSARSAGSRTPTSSSRRSRRSTTPIVGERGVKLSGGQRQRVAIARAILADPRILVLDEATSSLDSESEALIQDGLKSLRAGPDDLRHRAPAVDDPQRRSDPRARARRDRRARHARRAASRSAAATARSTTSSTTLEADRFINPGEDFTPEPARPEDPRRPLRPNNAL